MAARTLTINLPDGQETALLNEAATALGWDGVTGTGPAYLQRWTATQIRTAIQNGRLSTNDIANATTRVGIITQVTNLNIA